MLVLSNQTRDAIQGAARAFNGSRAFDNVRSLVEHFTLSNSTCRQDGIELRYCSGPLYGVTGTEGNEERAQRITESLQRSSWEAGGSPWGVWRDNFTAAFNGAAVQAHNIVSERVGASNRTLYLVAHYDSRPCADEDAEGTNRTKPVLGANDGGSGVGVIMELARALGSRPLNLTLRFLFVDAEDMGDSGHGCGQGTPWAQGAEHFAANMTAGDVQRARGVVLLDLVGDARMELRRELYSSSAPHRALQNDLWAWAARLGHAQFVDQPSAAIQDDHLPFQRRGIPSVDVIHLDNEGRDVFPESHHTAHDDLDHISAGSLEAVGQTVLAALLAWDAQEAPP